MQLPPLRTTLLAAAIAGYGALGVARAVTPLAPEFQVNTLTAGHQYRNRMSMSPNGDFVVTWTSANFDGSGFGIAAKRFDRQGAPLGADFVVNTYTDQDQQYSAVSVNEGGRFVVVWRSADEDGDETGIFARRFDETGAPQGTPFQVNTYTPDRQSAPDVAVGPAGGFFVVWESNLQDGSSTGIFARRHNDSGIAMATEFQANLATSGFQSTPRIAIVEPSNLIVLWNVGSAVGRRLGQAGVVGTEFVVNASGTVPALAPTENGGFLAVWQAGDGGLSGIFARPFALDGEPLASEFQVNAYTIGVQFDAEVAGNGTDFAVVWSSLGQDGDNEGVFARRLDAAGPVGAELQVNQFTIGQQSAPSVGMRADGAFVAVWDSLQAPGDTDVLARRLTILDLLTLDIDGDNTTGALTDGLLVLRFLFGFSGTTLVNGAVDENCARCDATTIVTYLDGLDLVLDIDDDGETDALTDGLLVLRFLFGFTGTTLTSGAVDTGDCMRCDATEIEAYLEGLD